MGARRAVLLRAVNVGGAKLPMARLRELATDLGATEVSTYIASGNLICVPPADPDDFDRALEQRIRDEFGFFREVISRSGDQVRAALAAYPFEVDDERFAHIYFLTGVPDPDRAQRFCARDFGADRITVIGDDLHIAYRNGVAGSRITPPVIEKGLGVTGTGRNLRTVAVLAERLP